LRRSEERVGCTNSAADRIRIEALERAIGETAQQEPWRELLARLRCLRGVDTLTALALVVEIGDFNRFKCAQEFMAFVAFCWRWSAPR
jgi:transposase